MATGWGRRVRLDMQKLVTNKTPASYSTYFAGLVTTNPLDDGSGVVASSTEPATGTGYGRVSITWGTPATGSLDATVPALNTNTMTWTSTGAFSPTGPFTHICIYDTSTLATVAEANYLGRAAITVPQSVAASGITLTIAASGLSMGLISA